MATRGVLPVLPTVMLTDPPTVTVDRPASPILQAGTAKVIFEVQSTGELRVTGNAWTDAQVFNPWVHGDRSPPPPLRRSQENGQIVVSFAGHDRAARDDAHPIDGRIVVPAIHSRPVQRHSGHKNKYENAPTQTLQTGRIICAATKAMVAEQPAAA